MLELRWLHEMRTFYHPLEVKTTRPVTVLQYRAGDGYWRDVPTEYGEGIEVIPDSSKSK